MESLDNTQTENTAQKLNEEGETGVDVSEYEQMIQKLEADVRNHIRVEQQLKLHIESIQNKLEEYERSQPPKKV